ncbi:MAG: branched-chain amino acid transport system II carrier protein [Negativicutes bacterium]|nr:branched-chain amino acid transport system II carrier protein [Negativicutes bacterium]
MSKQISFRDTLTIGLMLFSMFFGAGNLIFPPALGQAAGTNLWTAIIGFLITGVGMPLLGVMAIGLTGSNDSQALAKKVHPMFAIVLTVSTYLTIGPLFAIPRTGAVSYEVGIRPFLTGDVASGGFGLLAYTTIFFIITCWLSLNPTKIVDRVGKILTPVLLIVLVLLVAKVFTNPLGVIPAPTGEYATSPLFKGFREGYLTMDTLASMVFAIIVINAIKAKGIIDSKKVTRVCTTAGLIAAACLGLIYISLAYLGATSVAVVGQAANGGIILSKVANVYYGALGNVVLGLAIIFACLTTSIGLVSSCAVFFNQYLPKLSYKTLVYILSFFSFVVSNVGLTQLISFSVPVLVAIYPMVIVLILLSFLESLFGGRNAVYRGSMLFTAVMALIDGLNASGVSIGALNTLLSKYLPLFDASMGWVIPAIVGGVLGYFVSLFSDSSSAAEADSI